MSDQCPSHTSVKYLQRSLSPSDPSVWGPLTNAPTVIDFPGMPGLGITLKTLSVSPCSDVNVRSLGDVPRWSVQTSFVQMSFRPSA